MVMNGDFYISNPANLSAMIAFRPSEEIIINEGDIFIFNYRGNGHMLCAE